MPPRIETFFMKLICCDIAVAAGALQKLWKIGVMTIMNTMSTSATQRVFQPMRTASPPPSSTRIEIAARACGNGSPRLAM